MDCKTGKVIQNTFTFTKTAALLGLILIGLFLGWNHEQRRLHVVVVATMAEWLATVPLRRLGLNLHTGLAGACAGDVVRPSDGWTTLRAISLEQCHVHCGRSARSRSQPCRARCFLAVALVVGLYLLANLAYVVTLPLAGIQNAPQNRVATAVMQAVLGPRGTIIMAIAIMISTFGCNNGLILAGARVYYAMARDGLFFKRVGSVNAHNVPAIALMTQGLWAAFLVLPRTVTVNQQTGAYTYGNVYTQLLEYIVSADLIFYALMVGAVIVMRRKAPEIETTVSNVWLSDRAADLHRAGRIVHYRSCVSRAVDFRDWIPAGVYRNSGLHLVAQKGEISRIVRSQNLQISDSHDKIAEY